MTDLLHLFPNQDLNNTLFFVLFVLPFSLVSLYAGFLVLFCNPKPRRPEHDVRNCPLCGGGWVDQCSEYQASYGDSEDTLP